MKCLEWEELLNKKFMDILKIKLKQLEIRKDLLRKNYTKIDLGFSSLTDIIDLETITQYILILLIYLTWLS